jgi:hypothetical protein
MYTDEDLNLAVDKGIFSSNAVAQFRHYVSDQKQTLLVDEENFRLITGFNDVFVVIASALLMFSLAWLGSTVSPLLGDGLLAVSAWGLAEFFVLKRRMALPAIILLLIFLAAVFAGPIITSVHYMGEPNGTAFIISGILTALAARLHWLRFRVPITVAAGTAGVIACSLGLVYSLFPFSQTLLMPLAFVSGLVTFALAMYWDASDRSRLTRYSDVAFWLHLLSAPLIVHPIFASLGILQGVESISSAVIVVVLYIGLAILSIVVDRRAIMVSSLIYVLYAFSSLLETYGVVSYSFAITGICIGSSLLLLSAFWHNSRERILRFIPQGLQLYLPSVRV